MAKRAPIPVFEAKRTRCRRCNRPERVLVAGTPDDPTDPAIYEQVITCYRSAEGGDETLTRYLKCTCGARWITILS